MGVTDVAGHGVRDLIERGLHGPRLALDLELDGEVWKVADEAAHAVTLGDVSGSGAEAHAPNFALVDDAGAHGDQNRSVACESPGWGRVRPAWARAPLDAHGVRVHGMSGIGGENLKLV